MVQKLAHSNVIKLFHLLEENEEIFLVFPLMQYSLRSEVEDSQYAYQSQRVKDLMTMILSGVQHIHERNIVHRNLKPENILIDYDGTAKVGDFGLASFIVNGRQLKQPCGTKPYKAPELFLGMDYNKSVDIWVSL